MPIKYFILSVDGGGIRGIIPLRILEQIVGKIGREGILPHRVFDLMAGTSTGGIIVLGLNTVNPETREIYTIRDMIELYKSDGSQIFVSRQYTMWDRLKAMSPVIGSALSIGFLMLHTNEKVKILWSDLVGKMFFWGTIPTLFSHVFNGLHSISYDPKRRSEIMTSAVKSGLLSALRGSVYTGLFYPIISGSGIADYLPRTKTLFGLGLGSTVGFLYGTLRGNYLFRKIYDVTRIGLMAMFAAQYSGSSRYDMGMSCFTMTTTLHIFRLIESSFSHILSPRSKYLSPLETGLFQRRFGTAKLRDMPTEVLVAAVNARTYGEKSFTKTKHGRRKVYRIAAATSAAPTFFPQVLVGDDYYIDGGVGFNNPARRAWAFFKKQHPDASPSNTVILSLGTGEKPTEEKNFLEKTQEAAISILPKAISRILLGGTTVDEEMKQEFSGETQQNYIRIQAKLPQEIALDAVTLREIEEIEHVATQTVEDNQEKIGEFCRFFVEKPTASTVPSHLLPQADEGSRSDLSHS